LIWREPEESTAEAITFHAYRMAWWAGRRMPEHSGRLLFRWVGLLAHAMLPNARAIVAANQAQVLGRSPDDPLVRASTRAAFTSYARYWYDAFHVTEFTDREIEQRYHIVGEEHFIRAIEAGQGLIVALPHVGNWDVAGRWLQVSGYQMTTVVEHLRPRRLFELFRDQRQALGMDVVALKGGGSTAGRLTSALKKNRLLALVADRDLTGNGLDVEMFGRPRKVPLGPAMLSISTGAPVVIVGIYEDGDDWIQVIGPTLVAERTDDRRADVEELTRRIALEFERVISAAPSNWHMFQPGWDERP
jgi:phosphatidylinositol dimannoside acyltransferase